VLKSDFFLTDGEFAMKKEECRIVEITFRGKLFNRIPTKNKNLVGALYLVLTIMLLSFGGNAGLTPLFVHV